MALENKLNITDQAELAREEEKISKIRAKEMFETVTKKLLNKYGLKTLSSDEDGYVDVYEQVKLSENLKKNIDLEEMQKLYHNLIFDNKNNYIWFVWSD